MVFSSIKLVLLPNDSLSQKKGVLNNVEILSIFMQLLDYFLAVTGTDIMVS